MLISQETSCEHIVCQLWTSIYSQIKQLLFCFLLNVLTWSSESFQELFKKTQKKVVFETKALRNEGKDFPFILCIKHYYRFNSFSYQYLNNCVRWILLTPLIRWGNRDFFPIKVSMASDTDLPLHNQKKLYIYQALILPRTLSETLLFPERIIK